MSIRYGKVQVRARLPRGDWLWPAIWMMPKYSTYGVWPASGEIDIVKTKQVMQKVDANSREFELRFFAHARWNPGEIMEKPTLMEIHLG